eukprot:tig00000269_g23709.t1
MVAGRSRNWWGLPPCERSRPAATTNSGLRLRPPFAVVGGVAVCAIAAIAAFVIVKRRRAKLERRSANASGLGSAAMPMSSTTVVHIGAPAPAPRASSFEEDVYGGNDAPARAKPALPRAQPALAVDNVDVKVLS